MINTELLQKTLQQIGAHPEQWDQTMWAKQTSCGTSYCFAGWAVLLSGGKPDWERPSDYCDCGYEDYFDDDLSEWWAYYVDPGSLPDLTIVQWKTEESAFHRVAMRLLGLTEDEASRLFAESNDLDDLRRQVSSLIASAGAR